MTRNTAETWRGPGATASMWRAIRTRARIDERRHTINSLTFRRIALASAVGYALLVVTGGAVRLTGSGLGCLDWPTCSTASVTPAVSFHPLVEFSNRMVNVAVTLLSITTFLAALAMRPRRRDLVWLSFGLVGGIAGQIVIGGIVVLTKLDPYWVALHFVLTFVVLVDGIVLYLRADETGSTKKPLVQLEVVWLGRLLVATVSVLVVAGTMTTGSGPHAGGPGAIRVPVAFRDIAELHADIALFLIGMTLVTLFALHIAKAAEITQRHARTMLETMFVQGALGYTQYFLHDNALVVEFHLAGATAVWIAVLVFYLGLPRRAHLVDSAGVASTRAADVPRRHPAVDAPV